MRVFLDTNVLVAAFATRGLCEDVLQTVLTDHRLVVGETVLQELERILVDKLRMPLPKAQAVSEFVRSQAEVIRPGAPATWPESDPDDRWIAAAAEQGEVDVLVSGDRDFLDAAANAPFPVVSPRGFWERLR